MTPFTYKKAFSDTEILLKQLLKHRPCCVELFYTFPVGSGRVGSGLVDGNSDNRANSAQFQVKLPTGAELGNRRSKFKDEKQ